VGKEQESSQEQATLAASNQRKTLRDMQSTLSWINEHKSVGRVAVLMLLLVAMMGPWTYTADGVPLAEWCRDPNILLENGRCVRLMSGADDWS